MIYRGEKMIENIRNIIVKIQETSELNRLVELDNRRVFEEPLLGIASGYDPLFQEYKKEDIIGDYHMTPEEVMENKERRTVLEFNKDELSVICWVLPFAKHIVSSNSKKEVIPSIKWGHGYIYGESFNNLLRKTLEDYFMEKGILASAPVISDEWRRIENLPGGHTSNWSERHALNAAGMGTFSINDGFITDKGMAMRCGSIVVNKNYEITERKYKHHMENCLFAMKGICGICMERCPAFAITGKGHKKVQCRSYRDRFFGDFFHDECGLDIEANFCGLCQAGVPCAFENPMKKIKNDLEIG
jgi:epoxyqueuosine reductase QueG